MHIQNYYYWMLSHFYLLAILVVHQRRKPQCNCIFLLMICSCYRVCPCTDEMGYHMIFTAQHA